MIICVEHRFGPTKANHPVKWISYNGSTYIAADTSVTATALGLKPAITPALSPESNGMPENFVKTFRRDYFRQNILLDPETLLNLLPAWIDDYNEIHLYSGLQFLSPRACRLGSA